MLFQPGPHPLGAPLSERCVRFVQSVTAGGQTARRLLYASPWGGVISGAWDPSQTSGTSLRHLHLQSPADVSFSGRVCVNTTEQTDGGIAVIPVIARHKGPEMWICLNTPTARAGGRGGTWPQWTPEPWMEKVDRCLVAVAS